MGLLISCIELEEKTTVQMNELTPMEGCTIYNVDLKKLCFYNGTDWEVITSTVIV